MASLKGFCAECPCWFPIPDATLAAHHLCPCCLQPATKVRSARRDLQGPQFRSGLLALLRRTAQATGTSD